MHVMHYLVLTLINFIYAFILTISRLGLLSVNFCLFVTELWPLIDVRILFLLNVLIFPCLISLEIGLFTA